MASPSVETINKSLSSKSPLSILSYSFARKIIAPVTIVGAGFIGVAYQKIRQEYLDTYGSRSNPTLEPKHHNQTSLKESYLTFLDQQIKNYQESEVIKNRNNLSKEEFKRIYIYIEYLQEKHKRLEQEISKCLKAKSLPANKTELLEKSEEFISECNCICAAYVYGFDFYPSFRTRVKKSVYEDRYGSASEFAARHLEELIGRPLPEKLQIKTNCNDDLYYRLLVTKGAGGYNLGPFQYSGIAKTDDYISELCLYWHEFGHQIASIFESTIFEPFKNDTWEGGVLAREEAAAFVFSWIAVSTIKEPELKQACMQFIEMEIYKYLNLGYAINYKGGEESHIKGMQIAVAATYNLDILNAFENLRGSAKLGEEVHINLRELDIKIQKLQRLIKAYYSIGSDQTPTFKEQLDQVVDMRREAINFVNKLKKI